jgi:hypothetical protein
MHLKQPEDPVKDTVKIIYDSLNPEENETLEYYESSNPKYNWLFMLILYPIAIFFILHSFLMVLVTFGLSKENFDPYA